MNNLTLHRFTDVDGWRWYAESEEHYQAGDCYISVTQVLDHIVHHKLKSYFQKNSYNFQLKHKEKTANVGTAIHEAIEADLQGQTPTLTPETEKAFTAWKRFKKKYDIAAKYVELSVYHPTKRYAGTVDILGSFKPENSDRLATAVMDIKTGRFGIKTGWQLAAYYHALKELGYAPDGMVGLSIKRTGEPGTPFVYQHIDSCYKAFLASLYTFKMLYYNKLAKMNWKGLTV